MDSPPVRKVAVCGACVVVVVVGGFTMASGAGKAAQPPGPGSAVNGTAAELANIEQELYDYQMHSKMCKKIAQLTKVKGGRSRPHAITRCQGELRFILRYITCY